MEWREVVFIPGLQISGSGLIKWKAYHIFKGKERVLVRERYPKIHKDSGGDCYFIHNQDGRQKTVYVCDIVWNAFNPNNLVGKRNYVMHIDGNKKNNSIKNLKQVRKK